MNCPHCNKSIDDRNLDKAKMNCENYGDKLFTLQCRSCRKKYRVYLERVVKIVSIAIAPSESDVDFPL